MLSDPKQVIVLSEPGACPSVHTSCAHHRNLPELWAEGDTPREAMVRLAEQLSSALDYAPSHWRRETIERAIEDVKACAGQG